MHAIVKTQLAKFITKADVQCVQQESERLAGLKNLNTTTFLNAAPLFRHFPLSQLS